MKEYSTPEVIFDKFTTEEIAIGLNNSIEQGKIDDGDIGATFDFSTL